MSKKENKSIEDYSLITPGDVEDLFERAKKKQLESVVGEKKNIEKNNKDKNKLKKKDEKDIEKEKKENIPNAMILFDELGLAERDKTNPLKALHSKLEYKGKADGISFVGISNYTLDVDKINRILKLSVPDLENNMK